MHSSSSSSLLLHTPSASTLIRPSNPKKFYYYFNPRKFNYNSIRCSKASSSSSSYSITDFDLYDLLGIDSSSDKSQIKLAYRSLQKRCHPDIAGPAGHDMAIILNDVYSILTNPTSRLAYDKEQAKTAEFRGYTGKPLYSTWFGSESEERAVFVDEVKCVGCLKCALFAEKTFAIESVYGRARVVGQWADPEHKIQAAIEACPVDCISTVERSNLAALEFLMSKQPRGNVSMNGGNNVGTRVSNIFVDVKKFQNRFDDANDKASKHGSKESDFQREARMSAIQAIRSISNWLYWQSPISATEGPCRNLIPIAQNSALPNTDKIRDVAAAMRRAREHVRPTHGATSSHHLYSDTYWTPLKLILPAPTTTQSSDSSTISVSSPSLKSKGTEEEVDQMIIENEEQRNPMRTWFPVATATLAAVIIRLQVGETVAHDGVKEHIGGSMALEIVNSSWTQVTLVGLTWYFIGMAMVELVEAARSKQGNVKSDR